LSSVNKYQYNISQKFKDKIGETKGCQGTGTLGAAVRYCEGVFYLQGPLILFLSVINLLKQDFNK